MHPIPTSHTGGPERPPSPNDAVPNGVPVPAAIYDDADAWLAARRGGLGSSDAPAVLDLPGARPALAVFAEKRGLEVAPPEAGLSRALRVGLLMEPIVATLFADEVRDHGVTIVPTPWRYALHRHPDHPWMIATIDRFGRTAADDTVIVELKTVSHWAAKRWLEEGEVPPAYQVQVQHQLAVTGLRRAYVAALVAGFDLVWAAIDRDDEFIGALVDAEAAFWRRVQADDPPPAGDSDEAHALLKGWLMRASGGAVTSLPADMAALDEEREAILGELKRLERRKTAIDNTIMEHLVRAGATVGVLATGVQYEWRRIQRAAYQVEAGEYGRLFRRAGRR